MKRFAMVALLLAIGVTSLFGQGGQWALGIKAQGGVPTGDLKDMSDFGFGGTVWGAYMIDANATVTLRSGYLHFSGKDFNEVLVIGSTPVTVTAKTSLGVIPITAGLRYFFMPGDTRVYGTAEAGLYLLNLTADATASGGGVTVSASASSNESKFGINPTLGVQFKAGDKMNVDVHAAYTDVFTDGSSTNWVDFGIGLEFMLQ